LVRSVYLPNHKTAWARCALPTLPLAALVRIAIVGALVDHQRA
jgi:hypothetical protein